MKRKFKNLCSISGLLSLALLFSCCTDENQKPDIDDGGNDGDDPVEQENVLPEIGLRFAPISGLDEEGQQIGKAEWAEEDQIKTFVLPSGISEVKDWTGFQHKYVTDGKLCKQGKFIPEEQKNLDPEFTYDWYVMYPYSDDVVDPVGGMKSMSKFSMSGQIQDNENPSAHLAAYDIMTAVSREIGSNGKPNFKLEHKCAMMEFMVSNNGESEPLTIDKMEFSVPEGVHISGTYSIDFSKGGVLKPRFASNKATLSFKKPVVLQPGEHFNAYIMVPPFELEASDLLIVKVISGDEAIEQKIASEKGLNVVAGSLNAFQIDLFSHNRFKIELSETELFMKKGDKFELEATLQPDDGVEREFLWSSDHPEIAAVDYFGNVRGFSAGKATISVKVKDSDATATCDVYVTTLDKNKLVLKSGESSRFNLLNVPQGVGEMVWTTNAPEILSVDKGGNVTALQPGYAEVTVEVGKHGLKLTGSVTICPSDVDMEIIELGDVQIPMVKVQAGEFTMGATWDQGDEAKDNEKPSHHVTLTKDYYIGMFEVTQEIWNAVMDTIPCHYDGGICYPVEHVKWSDIVNEFLPKLNKMTGKEFTLPTEAQWEFAARGGNKTHNYKYSGSNVADDVAWFEDNSKDIENPDEGNHDSYEGTLHPHNVGMKLPNELGIYDMSGNVFEWCLDWFGGYSDNAQTDPQGPQTGRSKVLRGGSFDFEDARCRVAYRDSYYPYYWHFRYGFRLALNNL